MARPTLAPGTWGKIRTTKQDNGTWNAVTYYRRLDGKRLKASVSAKSMKAADRDLRAKLARLISQTDPDQKQSDDVVTFADVVREWLVLEELKLKQALKARGTHAEHLRNIRLHLLPAFGTTPVADIGPRAVYDLYTGMAATHSPLARNVKAVLRQILDHAISMEWAAAPNPADSVRAIRRRKSDIFAPGIEELRVFRKAIESYMRDADRPGPPPSSLVLDVVDIMLATGLRIGEVLGLRVEDVDLDGPKPWLEVRGAVKEKGGPKRWEPYPKSEHSKRRILLAPYAVELFRARVFAAEKDDTIYLFHTRTGAVNGTQDVHRTLRRVREHAGLPGDYVPHALRKSVSTEVANELGLEAAAKFAGHARSRVTEQHYAKRDLTAPDARDFLELRHREIVGE